MSVIDDGTPEVSLAITAQLDDPRARASLGLFSAILAEDSAIASNDGVLINTTFGINVKDPGVGGAANARATIAELTVPGNLGTSFQPSFTGSFDIDGLVIVPEVAGATIPGSVTIFSTNVTSPIASTPRAPAQFSTLSELGTVFDKIFVNNTIGATESLTPEAVASMIVQLGSSVQSIAGKLDIPEGIPFVKQAVSGLVDFSKMSQDFARQLYFNPSLIGVNDISVTNGVSAKMRPL